jgi:multiple sugar transport system substrate-binding protein
MSRNPRAVVIAALGSTLLLTALTACGSGGSTQSAAVGSSGNGTGTITWYANQFGPTSTDVRETLITAFEKANPGIKVKLEQAPSDSDAYRSALTTQISGGSSSFDVYNGDVVWPAQFGKAGLAQPLNDLIPSSYWRQFSPGLVDGLTYNGKIMAAPLFTDNAFLFYRKDLLEKAGLPVPTTWEQLRQEARQLQDAGQVRYGFAAQWAGYEGLTCDWTEFSADASGSSVDYQGTTARIDTPENLKALTYMKGLIDDGIAPKAVTTFKEGESQALFTSGQVAFLRNWAYAYSDAEENPNSKVSGRIGVINLPTFQGQISRGRTTTGGWNLYVNPHSRNIGADLAFVRWMTGLEAQRILALKGGLLPARSGVLDDVDLQDANPVFRIAFMNRMVARPTWTADYAEISKAIYTDVNAALTGTTTPANALRKAQGDITGALAATP